MKKGKNAKRGMKIRVGEYKKKKKDQRECMEMDVEKEQWEECNGMDEIYKKITGKKFVEKIDLILRKEAER